MPQLTDITREGQSTKLFNTIAENPDLQHALEEAGYTSDVIAQGRALHDAHIAALNHANQAQGRRINATKALQDQMKAMKIQVSGLEKIVRSLFGKDAGVLRALDMRQYAAFGTVKTPEEKASRQPSKSQAAFLAHARSLYDGALARPDVLEKLATVGYPAARLASEREQVLALAQADAAQEVRKAEAKASTAALNAAERALDQWVSQLATVAKVHMRARPDLLDKLGL
ncbi:hypothetical protein F8S13_10260 [Chloroflexia bacterium SDU3-3]|nr:hypothetical protein F8S13_10260 [Chloroflexia bacterium SDU3-3]